MDALLRAQYLMPINTYTPVLTPLKSILELLQVITGILLVAAYFYLWSKSGVRIMGQTYREACYTKPYICASYLDGVCDWCKVHDEREVHKLKQVFDLLMGFADDAGLVDKGYEDKGIRKGMILDTAAVLFLSSLYGAYQYQLSDSISSLSVNYQYLSPMIKFLINLSSGVGAAATLFSIWFMTIFLRYQFYRITEYSKKKYGYNIYREDD
jgi:hypothetical protein